MKDYLLDEAGYEELYERSISDPEAFWSEQAESFVTWYKPWKSVLNWDYKKGLIRWFKGGKLNVCYNCVDRHLPHRANQVAILWEGNEPGENRSITYLELSKLVQRFSNVLITHGVKKGDRVIIYMPMIPEAAIAMLACARIGAIHSVVFAGFSAEALKDRILDSGAKLVITANEGLRGDKVVPLKKTVDEVNAERVLVYKRTDSPCYMKEGRDYWLDLESAKDECVPEEMDSEDPLFILYTSGSTGKPKGLLHTQAGYLLYTAMTFRYVFDYKDNDIHFCAADVGWITGHSYIVYGPLANGATTVMFESIPTYPDPGRYWDTVERFKANTFYTAPTAIRAIAKEGNSYVKKYDRSSLKVLGTVGEPINKNAWEWYSSVVGENRCPVVDTWWQTETGGILISPLPGAIKTKPGSATKPFFGIRPVLLKESGEIVTNAGESGRLCIEFPWPGQARTVWGDHERFVTTYFRSFLGYYFTGDAAKFDQDGYFWISGRVDDVLNVSGHRIGTAEIESAIIASGVVAEAAVIGFPHEIKGEGICAFCIPNGEENARLVLDSVTRVIGSFAKPDKVIFVSGLPKTRSGKIMRRILRKIASGETDSLGDISTLAEPSVVEELITKFQITYPT